MPQGSQQSPSSSGNGNGIPLQCDAPDPHSAAPPPLLRLTVSQTEAISPNMPVRWCISQAAVDELREACVEDPHLLIVIAREDPSARLGERLTEVSRMLLPLDQGYERIMFPRGGMYRVFALVVWSPMKTLEHRWRELSHLKERGAVARVNGEEIVWRGSVDLRRLSLTNDPDRTAHPVDAELRVTVDGSFFAKEPSKLLAWFGNLWCAGKPRDECHFRKRLLWAFGIKWALMLCWIAISFAIRSVYAPILAFIGRRSISLKPLVHPFGMSLYDVEDDPRFGLDDSRGYWTKTELDGTPRSLWFYYGCTPYWITAHLVVAWLTVRYSEWTLPGLLLKNWVPFAGAGIFYLLHVGLVYAWRAFVSALNKTLNRRIEPEEERARLAHEAGMHAYYAKRLEPLVCPDPLSGLSVGSVAGGSAVARPKPPRVSAAALPKSHQTVRLRFRDLKAKVCRPFQQ